MLVYWSGTTYKTCDARYIGRDVRDCHPESSLECLEEILREFKAAPGTWPRAGSRTVRG